MTTNYRRGADFERELARRLEYWCGAFVVRAAGSHGPCDLVAVPDSRSRRKDAWLFGRQVLLIQARADGAGRTSAWNALEEVTKHYRGLICPAFAERDKNDRTRILLTFGAMDALPWALAPVPKEVRDAKKDERRPRRAGR